MARATLVTPSGPLGRLTNVIIGSPRGKAPAFETDGAAETKQAREKPGWKNPKKIQACGVCAAPLPRPQRSQPSIRAGTVPTGCSIDGALLLSGLRLSAVRDYTGTLPQCKAIARPPLAGGLVGCQRHRQIINISDTLNHVAARVPAVDAVSEIRLGGCHKGGSARERAGLVFTRIFGI